MINNDFSGGITQPKLTTLDEPVSETIMRDLKQVYSKLRVVLMPRDQAGVLQKLKDWDLWGPLLVCLSLSILLCITAPPEQSALVFAAVFVLVWVGAAIVTLNAQLLGGNISFFQSVCVLGYCVFPLDVAALILLFFRLVHVNYFIIKLIFVSIAFAWATRASVVFIGQIIVPQRKLLAVYPVFFFYTFISWMIIIQ